MPVLNTSQSVTAMLTRRPSLFLLTYRIKRYRIMGIRTIPANACRKTNTATCQASKAGSSIITQSFLLISKRYYASYFFLVLFSLSSFLGFQPGNIVRQSLPAFTASYHFGTYMPFAIRKMSAACRYGSSSCSSSSLKTQ